MTTRPVPPTADAPAAPDPGPAHGPDFGRDVFCVLGLPFDGVGESQAEQIVRDAAASGRRCLISTPNLNFAIACADDAAFRESVVRSDLSVADGMPIVWIARLLGAGLPQRVPGSGLFDRLVRRRVGAPIRTYFFGGDDGVAEAACRALHGDATGAVCVGHMAPGFGSVEQMSAAPVIDEINRSGAQLLVVAIGARKGQAWLLQNADRLEVPVRVYLGAALNFVAGRVRRAPRAVQQLGMEWLWRIRQEPMLWRRYRGDGAALARSLLTRVLPLAIALRVGAPGAAALARARVEVDRRPEGSLLRLEGAWSRSNLGALRETMAGEAKLGRALRFDLGAVTFIDTAVAGLLVLAAQTHAPGVQATVVRTSARVRRMLAWMGAGYLTESSGAVSGAALSPQNPTP